MPPRYVHCISRWYLVVLAIEDVYFLTLFPPIVCNRALTRILRIWNFRSKLLHIFENADLFLTTLWFAAPTYHKFDSYHNEIKNHLASPSTTQASQSNVTYKRKSDTLASPPSTPKRQVKPTVARELFSSAVPQPAKIYSKPASQETLTIMLVQFFKDQVLLLCAPCNVFYFINVGWSETHAVVQTSRHAFNQKCSVFVLLYTNWELWKETRNKLRRTLTEDEEPDNLRITTTLLLSGPFDPRPDRKSLTLWEIYSVMLEEHLYPVENAKIVFPLGYSDFLYGQELFERRNAKEVRDSLRDKAFYDDLFGIFNTIKLPCFKKGQVEKHVNHCRFLSILIVIVMDHLNASEITVLPAMDFDELAETNLLSGQARYISLDLITDEDINFIFKLNSDFAYHTVDRNTYFYCVDNVAWVFGLKWDMFLAPFEPPVLVVIALFGLLISVLNALVTQPERNIYNIVKVFWTAFNTAAKNNFKQGVNFTSPYKSDENGNAYFVLGNFTYHSTSHYEVMRRLKGYDMFEILEELLHIRENGKFFDTRNGITRCFLVNQNDGKQTKRFLLVSFHFWKNKLQQVGKNLEQAGIHRYWQVVENWQRLYNEFLPGNEEGVSFGGKEYSPIPLNSHVQMIFYLLICSLLFTGIVLASEYLGFEDMHRVKQAAKKRYSYEMVVTVKEMLQSSMPVQKSYKTFWSGTTDNLCSAK
ncbi:hypothetical protein Fcan01_22719 [Folsomia candida]|uniref:Uncharacterized protein n=1 Tax=Folsomia candida TaxID=158441 RepID=A0A226DDW9_FOLCA|nr:hypothetical protein Fcan01_22719 [Folsomia candida]